jgi:hypothetical protein
VGTDSPRRPSAQLINFPKWTPTASRKNITDRSGLPVAALAAIASCCSVPLLPFLFPFSGSSSSCRWLRWLQGWWPRPAGYSYAMGRTPGFPISQLAAHRQRGRLRGYVVANMRVRRQRPPYLLSCERAFLHIDCNSTRCELLGTNSWAAGLLRRTNVLWADWLKLELMLLFGRLKRANGRRRTMVEQSGRALNPL